MTIKVKAGDGAEYAAQAMPVRGHRGGLLIVVFQKADGGRHMMGAAGVTVNGVEICEGGEWTPDWENAARPKKKAKAAKKAAARPTLTGEDD